MQAPAPKPFSASDAALDGFRVIGQRWRVIAGWSLFNLVALVTMVVITVIMIFIVAATAGSDEQASTLGGVIGGLGGGLGTLIIEVVVIAGLYRMLLRPEEPAFLHLRLGPDELRLAGVWLVLGAAFITLFVLGGGIAFWAGEALGFAAGLAAGLLMLAGLVYLGLRLALVTPMTFAARRFQFTAAWRATRGRVLPLLGMSALAFCLLVLVAVVGWVSLSLIIWAATGFKDLGLLTLNEPEHLIARPGAYLTQMAAQLLVSPFLWVIAQAPLVAAFRAFGQDAPPVRDSRLIG